MPEVNIDFEGGAIKEPSVTIANNTEDNPATQEDTTSLNSTTVEDVTGKDNTTVEDNKQKQDEPKEDQPESSLEAGTKIEFDGKNYVVDEKGNIVNDKGEIFKEAKDVDAWLKENNAVDAEEDQSLDIQNIISKVGVEITDDNGEPVKFSSDAKGISDYIAAVIDTKSNELQQGAINKLYQDNPLLKQFIDYVQLTGTYRGFGDIPDRSGIVLDKENENQLEAVIRMAAQEFGNASLNDNYINYLKSSGALYDEARAQLEALVQKDKDFMAQLEQEAQEAREQQEQAVLEYWQNVNDKISKRTIGKYTLPETFVKEINGKKVTLTLNDFYSYLAKSTEVDEDGRRISKYQNDLNKMSNEDLLNKELLDAWLMFTGGSYKDLVDMAIKENEVKKLVVKSNNIRNQRTIRVNKANKGKVDMNDIML